MKQLLKKYFPKGSAVSQVSALVSGAALGQAAALAASPVLTRLYTPEEFGVLAIYASLLGMIGIVSGLRYELAIPLTRTDGSAANVLVVALLSVGSTTLLLVVIVAMFGNDLLAWANISYIAPYLWLLPLGVLLNGLFLIFNYWAIRRNNFNQIAYTRAQQGISGAIVQVGLGFLQIGPLGLILGQIISQSAGLIRLFRVALSQDASLTSRVKWRRVKQRARRYSRFPKFTTWASLANSSSTLLPPLLFAILFSPQMAGIYMLAHRTMQAPSSLIGRSVGQVFHKKAADARHRGELDVLMLKAFKRLLRISLIPLTTLGFFAPDLFALIFGQDWTQAGIYVQWMVPWIIAQFVVSPLSTIISVTESQVGGLISQLLFPIVRIGALLVGASAGGSDDALFYYSMSGVAVYSGLWLWMLRIVGLRIIDWIRDIYKDLFAVILVIMVLSLFQIS